MLYKHELTNLYFVSLLHKAAKTAQILFMAMMAFKYRLLPNVTQTISLNKTMGAVRFFWNKQVEAFKSYDKENNNFIKYKTSTEIRNENVWMREVSAAAIQQKEIDFKQYKTQRFSKGRKKIVNDPLFKKSNSRQSFRLPNQKFAIIKNKIRLEKIGHVRIVVDRKISNGCKIMNATVSKDSCGKYFVSILVDTKIENFEKTGKTVGVDVGIKELATLSDGTVIKNPMWFRNSQAKLKKLQRRLSKKVKGSSRYNKCKLRISMLHKKIGNQRSWYLHNLTTSVVRNFDTISIEDLDVDGMKKNKNISKSITDAAFPKLFSMLDYKCDWYGKTLVKIPRFFPSSKTCSSCGNVKKELKLRDRTYVCSVCGHKECRDLNASKNINAIGVKIAERA